MRRLKDGLGLLTCATLAWTVLDGPVFVTPAVDRATKAVLVLIVAVALVSIGVALATELSLAVLECGAPGLHFFTQNRSLATRSILQRVRAARG